MSSESRRAKTDDLLAKIEAVVTGHELQHSQEQAGADVVLPISRADIEREHEQQQRYPQDLRRARDRVAAQLAPGLGDRVLRASGGVCMPVMGDLVVRFETTPMQEAMARSAQARNRIVSNLDRVEVDGEDITNMVRHVGFTSASSSWEGYRVERSVLDEACDDDIGPYDEQEWRP